MFHDKVKIDPTPYLPLGSTPPKLVLPRPRLSSMDDENTFLDAMKFRWEEHNRYKAPTNAKFTDEMYPHAWELKGIYDTLQENFPG